MLKNTKAFFVNSGYIVTALASMTWDIVKPLKKVQPPVQQLEPAKESAESKLAKIKADIKVAEAGVKEAAARLEKAEAKLDVVDTSFSSAELAAITRVAIDSDAGMIFENFALFDDGVQLLIQDDGRTLRIVPAQNPLSEKDSDSEEECSGFCGDPDAGMNHDKSDDSYFLDNPPYLDFHASHNHH